MLSVEEIITRLKLKTTLIKDFGGSIELEQCKGNTARTSAWVIPVRESAADEDFYSYTQQTVTAEFDVIISVSNARDSHGREAYANLAAVRAEILAALLGWSPTVSDFPCHYAGGEAKYIWDGLLQWAEKFRYTYTIIHVLQ